MGERPSCNNPSANFQIQPSGKQKSNKVSRWVAGRGVVHKEMKARNLTDEICLSWKMTFVNRWTVCVFWNRYLFSNIEVNFIWAENAQPTLVYFKILTGNKINFKRLQTQIMFFLWVMLFWEGPLLFKQCKLQQLFAFIYKMDISVWNVNFSPLHFVFAMLKAISNQKNYSWFGIKFLRNETINQLIYLNKMNNKRIY